MPVVPQDRNAAIAYALSGLRAAIANEMELVATQAQVARTDREKTKLSPTRSMIAAGHHALGYLRDAERSVRRTRLDHVAPRLRRACWQVTRWRQAVEEATKQAARYDGDRTDHPDVAALARTVGRVLAELHALLGATDTDFGEAPDA